MRKTLLEDKAFELAYHGSETRVTKGKGDNASTEVRTDYPAGALLQFLLKAEVPDKYGIDRQEIKAGPLDEPPTVIRSNAQREKLLAKLQSRAREREEIPGAADVPIDPSLFT
jgi:hypothetical protein